MSRISAQLDLQSLPHQRPQLVGVGKCGLPTFVAGGFADLAAHGIARITFSLHENADDEGARNAGQTGVALHTRRLARGSYQTVTRDPQPLKGGFDPRSMLLATLLATYQMRNMQL